MISVLGLKWRYKNNKNIFGCKDKDIKIYMWDNFRINFYFLKQKKYENMSPSFLSPRDNDQTLSKGYDHQPLIKGYFYDYKIWRD